MSVGVEKIAGVCGGRAIIAGVRIPVWQVVAELGVAPSARAIDDYARQYRLSHEQVCAALVHARAHAREIAMDLAENAGA